MKFPYSKLELQISLLGVDNKKFTEEKFREIEEEFKDVVENFSKKASLNRVIAEYQGITVEQLVNSSNYQVLCEEYTLSLLEKVVEKTAEKFEVTEKQAWAMIAMSMGLLD